MAPENWKEALKRTLDEEAYGKHRLRCEDGIANLINKFPIRVGLQRSNLRMDGTIKDSKKP